MNLEKLKILAEKVSHKSDHHIRVGAVLFKRKAIFSVRHNHLFKTHPEYNKINLLGMLHAEAACVLSCRNKQDLRGSTILVQRRTFDGELAIARPCQHCMVLLRKYGISRVIYSSPEGWKEELI